MEKSDACAGEGLRMWISFKTWIWEGAMSARARGSDRRFRRFKNCSASRLHSTIPPTKLLTPVAVLATDESQVRFLSVCT